jgi:hypothetical protein
MHQWMGRKCTICKLPQLKQSYRQRLSTAAIYTNAGPTLNQVWPDKYNHQSIQWLQHNGVLLFLSHPHLTGMNSWGQWRLERSQFWVTLCSGLLCGPGYFGCLTERDRAISNPTLYTKCDLPRYTVVP